MQNYVNTQYCNAGGKKNRYGVRLTVVQNSQSVANNTSNITVTFELGGAGSLGLSTDYTGSSFYGSTCTGTINVGGVQKAQSSSTPSINNSTKVTLASWTGNVSHNADGTLTLYIEGVFTGGNSTQASGGVAGGNVTFDTIPRASTVTCTTANIGANPTFTITRASSGFTHTLKYSFGSLSGTIATGVGTSYNSWSIPTTFYAQIPSSPSGTGTITCETYNGSTYIGSKTCSFTVNVPSTAKPNISNPTIVDTDTVSKNTIQLYVVGKSKLQFTFPAFSTNYSSTLKSYTLNINGTQVYSGTDTSYTMSTPISTTTNNYELIIKDSRDITNTTGQVAFTAYAYTEPKITLFTAERNATTATTVNMKYSATITNINSNNRNAKSFKIEYRQLNSETWTTVTTATDAYTKTNVSVNATNISDSNTFEFRLTVTDSYGSATYPIQVGTSATLINFSADGTAIAFGKASETASTFECDLKSKFTKQMDVTGAMNVSGNVNFTGNVNKNGNDILKGAYDRIGTLSSLTTTTKTDTVSAINEIAPYAGLFKHYIDVKLSARTTSTPAQWTHTKINLNSTVSKKGNLSLANNGVAIGAGISCVLILASMNFGQGVNYGEFDLQVHKGTSSSLGSSVIWSTSTANGLGNINAIGIIPVAQNDYIYACFATGNANTSTTIYEDTRLIVIAVA